MKWREYQLTDEKQKQIQKEFNKFDRNETGRIFSRDAIIVLRNLGLERNEEFENLLKQAEMMQMNKVRFEQFIDVIKSQLALNAAKVEIKRIFEYFASRPLEENETDLAKILSKQKEKLVKLEQLKFAAREMGELLCDQDLQDMVDEADKQKTGKIDLESFTKLMLKTNLW